MRNYHILYEVDAALVALTLLILIVALSEIGYRLGRYVQQQAEDEVKEITSAIQASMFGLLALLLGFAFSMSLQRYDNRTAAVTLEANAIGTALLRAELLESPLSEQQASLIKAYVDLRVKAEKVDLTQHQLRSDYERQVALMHQQLWQGALSANRVQPGPTTTGLYLQAMNDLIDSYGSRTALLYTQVPEEILLLLFFVLLTSCAILGYSNGLASKRVATPTFLVSLLFVSIIFTIMELDRPKRGFIKIDQSSVTDLQRALISQNPNSSN